MLRFEAKLNISDLLKGQSGSKFNEKENASNISTIKARNFADMYLEQWRKKEIKIFRSPMESPFCCTIFASHMNCFPWVLPKPKID
jgi:hypothetical protein